MNRARLKNIINKSKGISENKTVGDPFDLFVKTMPTELDYYKDSNNYRLKAAWEAYGKPKNVLEAWYEGLVDVNGNKLVMPSIGYNNETDSYEYLNTGKENDIVNKDIRVWENDAIPFVKELKNGGYIRTFNEELNCWMYKKGGKTKPKFEEWYKTLPKEKSNTDDYDLETAYNELPFEELEEFRTNPSAHLSGDYKKPNHMTYNEPGYGWKGSDEEGWTYTVSPRQMSEYGRTFLDYVDYWNHSEPKSVLIYGNRKYKVGDPIIETQAFKQGGQMNVIPEGALHAHKNHMELAEEGEITHKGIPVVDKEGGQVAEVEKEEITFTKPVTEKLEDWYKKFYAEDTSDKEKDELAIKCGKFLTKEILFNTDDRVGLIDKIKELEGLQ